MSALKETVLLLIDFDEASYDVVFDGTTCGNSILAARCLQRHDLS
jgi:hypothetical protein